MKLECVKSDIKPKGSPTRTGEAYIKLVDKYRKVHPDRAAIPSEKLDEYWLRAVLVTGNTDMLKNINAVRAIKGQEKIG